jgi:hypothetical protein
MLPMTVLDAKALEIDPKGMAFLASVLRQKSASRVVPEEVSPSRKIINPMRMRFRLSRPPKELLSDLA